MNIKFINPKLQKLLLALLAVIFATAVILLMQKQTEQQSHYEAQSMMTLRHILRIRNAMDDGKNKQAEDICLALLKEDPGNGEVLKLLGMAYLKQGKLLSAEKYLRQAALAMPYSPAVFRFLGLTMMKQGEMASASNELQRSYSLDRNSPATLFLLQECCMRSGDRAGAERFAGEYNAIINSGAEKP